MQKPVLLVMASWVVILTACSGTSPLSNAALSQKSTATTAALHTSQNVSIIVEPSDQAQALINAINAATTSVHVTMYLMTDYGVEDAIVAKAKAGLDVKVVLDPSIESGTTHVNQSAYNWFTTHGVATVWAPAQFTFTHEKCVILDNTTAWIMTMNTAHTSPIDNREYLAIDTDANDVAEAEAIFAADYANQPVTPSGALVVSPVNSDDKLVKLIYSANTSIDVEVEELSDDDIVTGLCVAQAIGITTRAIIADETDRSNAQEHAILDLENCGVTVVTVAVPYIHAKAIVVDGTTAYVGSVNFTEVSMEQNRELGLITNNPVAVQVIAAQVAADIASGQTVTPPPSCQTAADCAVATDACDEGMCQTPCIGDECAPGYVCVIPTGGYDGACQVQTTLTCTTASDCTSGLVCTNALCSYCQGDQDCPTGMPCQSDGYCQTASSSSSSYSASGN